MGSRTTMLACQGLSKRFGSMVAVDDLTFDVPAGAVTGFVGANGAGKSTTMRMLLGLIEPTAGHALVAGRQYRELDDPRRVVGAALDGPGAHPGRNARTHLSIVATAAGLPGSRVGEVLERVELGAHADRRVGSFSLGMRQRLALATAMLGDPRVLVLDEPATGLDPPGMVWLRGLLRDAADDGKAVFVSSHLLAELAEIADRMIILDRGRLVADGPLDALLGRARVEVRCADPVALARAVQAWGATAAVDEDLVTVEGMTAREVGELAAASGAGPVHQLTERAPSLEETYLQLAGTLGAPAMAASRRSA